MKTLFGFITTNPKFEVGKHWIIEPICVCEGFFGGGWIY